MSSAAYFRFVAKIVQTRTETKLFGYVESAAYFRFVAKIVQIIRENKSKNS